MQLRFLRLIWGCFAGVLFLAPPGWCEEAKPQPAAISIIAPWIMATPPSAKVGGAFLTIKNAGPAADRLVGAKTDVADSIEIHEMKMVNGVMMMSHNHPGVSVQPKATVVLKPFANHLMLMDLKRQLTPGETVKIELDFEKAGPIVAEFKVEPIGSSGPQAHAH